MKTQVKAIFAYVGLVGLLSALLGCTTSSLRSKHARVTAATTEVYASQVVFSGWDPGAPIILCHPETQVVLQGTSVTFTVQADHAQPGLPGTFTYQWQINKGPNATNFTNIDGETSASYTIDQTTTNHVALYRVLVSGSGTAISHPACLQVYVPGNSFTVFGTPLLSSGGGGTTCPGSYVGYVNYKKSIAEGWGWLPDHNSGNTAHSAQDITRTNTKVQAVRKDGAGTFCNQTSVSISHPTGCDEKPFRFTIYFPDNVPTSPYPIQLNGFLP